MLSSSVIILYFCTENRVATYLVVLTVVVADLIPGDNEEMLCIKLSVSRERPSDEFSRLVSQ